MSGLIFNEDPNHFIFSRALAGYKEITADDAISFIRQYQNSNISDFMICVNASITWYDSVKTKNIITQYKEWLSTGKTSENESDMIVKSIHLLTDFYDRYGKVPQDYWIEELRKLGIRPWTSVRMNDIHETDRSDSILFSDFYREHRAKNRASHRGAVSYYEYGLDYMQKSVRDHYITVIEEALERFDTDGLELDWMREIYSVGIGREYEGIAVINEFMGDVYAMVKRMEKKRGHAISIAVRLPDTPEKALRLGFDVFQWVENNWIDLITPTPRWSSSDHDMPIDIWKKIFKDKPVTIAAGTEILMDAYNRRGRKYLFNTYETAIANSCAYLFSGADAIYLFNYMDALTESANRNSLVMGETYRKFLSVAGDYEACKTEKRRHVVTYNDVSAIGANAKKQLPQSLSGNGTPDSFATVRIVTGEIPKNRTVHAILGIEAGGDFSPEALQVYLSARKCTLGCEVEAHDQQYTDIRFFSFDIEHDGTLPPVSVLEVGLALGTAKLHWAEIEIV